PRAGDIDAECVQRRVELLAASAHEPARWPRDVDGVAGTNEPGGLVGDRAPDRDPAGVDQLDCSLAARRETPSDEFGVEPAPRGDLRLLGCGLLGGSLLLRGSLLRRCHLLGCGLLGGSLLLRGRLLRRTPPGA